jgi:hypothetical protein
MEDLIFHPLVIQILAVIVVGVWSLPKIHHWRESIKDGMWFDLVHFAKEATTITYNEYVQEIKARKSDGKLTQDERRVARKKAKEKLTDILTAEAPGILKKYGDWAMELAIETAVAELKRL